MANTDILYTIKITICNINILQKGAEIHFINIQLHNFSAVLFSHFSVRQILKYKIFQTYRT